MDDGVCYNEVNIQKAVTKLKRKIPYGWDLNIYRGCEHGCQYCFALYSHQYLGGKNFFKDIYVKTNIVDQLEKQLRSPAWKGDIINLGGVTDSYQHVEDIYQLMPQVLKIMIKYKNPIIISTKSDLILRDFDLIDQLSRLTYVNIASTITAVDERVQGKIEPYSSATHKRFQMLKQFKKTSVSTGVHLMPIIPFITDNDHNLEEIIAGSKECDVDYILTGTLYLRGLTRAHFIEFIYREYPHIADEFLGLYLRRGGAKEYKKQLYCKLNTLKKQYQITSNYMESLKKKLDQYTMPLFTL